ncbi:MAG: hypothetical protein V8S89_06730 [Oscillospiraceae bacterium]
MSAEASDMSSYLLMGLPGLAYLSGPGRRRLDGHRPCRRYVSQLASFTAKRLRRYTHITGSFTLPRVAPAATGMKRASSRPSPRLSLSSSSFLTRPPALPPASRPRPIGANYMTTMIISAIVIVAYTAAGGFLAASITDFIQSIIMTVALLFVLIFATVSAGGVDAVMENAKALPGYLSLTSTYVADSRQQPVL